MPLISQSKHRVASVGWVTVLHNKVQSRLSVAVYGSERSDVA